MIKTLTKIFAFTAVTKSLLETKRSQSAGTTQIHPSKIPGRTLFIREKEYFIRENIMEGTTPIIFLHSWGSDSLGSWFKILPKIKNENSFVAIDMRNHGKSDASWDRWDVDENADVVISILKELVDDIDPESTKLIIGGHSLGALLSLKAISLPSLQEFKTRQVCAVGFGLPPEGVTHIFDTPFYKSTLAIRGQLVSEAIKPDVMFPWIKEEKEALDLTQESIYLLTGEDDVVVGKDGSERLRDQLLALGNDVVLEKPNKLAHHLPESAAPHLKKWLKDQGFFQN